MSRSRASFSIARPITLVVGVGAAVTFLGLSAVAVIAEPSVWELESFRTVNELPDWVEIVLWPLMQYGAMGAIPVVATITWFLGRRRLAIVGALAALSGYALARVAKSTVGRGRPTDYLDRVIEREDFAIGSLGYPSGHAVVAATITTIALHVLPVRLRILVIGVTLAVLFGRVYIGGHLALDMIGGAALGVALGAAATLVVDRFSDEGRPPRDRRS